ncbi:unnamed protein product [Penicillium egyptiacum]|uniref:Transcription factor domain-containing protein n=1 Tax=Penicillium egyptiacum TaxID=1303716 RepID=A0A9W4P241_9EURO|nr:unnamed protein product [Penicillium egyptiacum]
MASIGASYYDDAATATLIHLISKTYIIKYVRKADLFINHVYWLKEGSIEPAHYRRQTAMGAAVSSPGYGKRYEEWEFPDLPRSGIISLSSARGECDKLSNPLFGGCPCAVFRHVAEGLLTWSYQSMFVLDRSSNTERLELEGGHVDLLQRWLKWINFEMTVQTICSIYIYLGALGATFQTASCSWNVDMSDCFLPCEESEWVSISPQAWFESRKSNCKPPIRFSAAMANLFSSQWEPSLQLSIFGSYVTLHGIVKLLANFYKDSWLLDPNQAQAQLLEQALVRWRMCAEQNPEFHCSARYPSDVIPANALSLSRQAHVRLCGKFRPIRSALATRNVQTISSSLDDIKVEISGSSTYLKAAWCAIEALQTSVRMGMSHTGSISGWHSKLFFNVYSLEFCISF